MATILDKQNITQAKTAISTYSSTCSQLYNELSKVIAELRKTHFIGDASNGFDVFFAQVSPALSSNLYGSDNSITLMLNQLIDAVDKALLDTVDPDLGKANQNAAN